MSAPARSRRRRTHLDVSSVFRLDSPDGYSRQPSARHAPPDGACDVPRVGRPTDQYRFWSTTHETQHADSDPRSKRIFVILHDRASVLGFGFLARNKKRKPHVAIIGVKVKGSM